MLVLVYLAAYFLINVTGAARILGIFMTPSYSHQIVFQPIWKELSLRGHQVTVYTPYPLNDTSLTNLTEYDLSLCREACSDVDKVGQNFDKLFDIWEEVCDRQLSHQYFRHLIRNDNNDTYDLLLVEYLWQSMYAFKELYKVPMIGVTSIPLSIQGSDALGMERHSVLDPDYLLKFSYAETFTQRLLSWGYNWLYRLAFKIKFSPRINAQIERHFGKMNKSAFDLASEVNLVLGNYNFAMQNVKPMTRNYIPISSIHVRPLEPLPQSLASFLESLQNDVIYFSLGTNVRASQVHKPTMDRILNILGHLPYTILWKYDSNELPGNLSKNFYVRNWFPQQDILGHPKVKLFITQGGLQSIDEALSRKVPMLVIPFHGDQKTNADRCVRLGIAKNINIAAFTDDEFREKLNNLLADPSYQRNIDKQSLIASDQPLNSLDTAIYWIEYVIRHEGAPHLRYGAVDLPFYQYYLLDIYLCIGVVLGVLYYVGRKLAPIIFLIGRGQKRSIISRFSKPSQKKKQL